LRLRWQLSPDDAQDAVQAFFTTAFEKRYVDRFDPAKARFRTFLRMCLDRFVQNLQKAERTAKRGGRLERLPLDFEEAEAALAGVAATDLRDLDRFFRDEMIRSLFARSVNELRLAETAAGREHVFRVFERHDLRPSPGTTYASVARELGLTVSQVTNHLHSARGRFRAIALGHLRGLCGTDGEFRQEARALFGVEPAE
jgi:DNA-directed RNA polymerase specialized sigma24 family protein